MTLKRPFIVEIHLRIQPFLWSQAKRQLVILLRRPQIGYAIQPLYVTYDVEETELRVCLQFSDPIFLEHFIVREVRKKVPGILGTRVRLTLNGEIFPEGVSKLVQGELVTSCHVFLSVEARKDDEIEKALRALPIKNGVVPTWFFRDYYEFDRDITVRLIGRSQQALRVYVESQFNKLIGVRSWRLQFIQETTRVASQKVLQEMASAWVRVNAKKPH